MKESKKKTYKNKAYLLKLYQKMRKAGQIDRETDMLYTVSLHTHTHT